MSVRCSSAVWQHSRSKGSARLVLLAIADHAHDDGTDAFPKIEHLCTKTRLSEKGVRNNLRVLESLGELEVEKRGRRNTYRVVLPGLDIPAKSTGVEDSEYRQNGDQIPADSGQEYRQIRDIPQTPYKEEPSKPNRPVTINAQSFDAFWDLYPPRNGKKVDKQKAQRVWVKLSSSKRDLALAGVRHYADACNAGMTLAKDAHRWLRDECWTDWQSPARASPVIRDRFLEATQIAIDASRGEGNGRAGAADSDLRETRRSLPQR